MTLTFTALIAYLIGSIPFGVLITRFMGLGDLRRIGSGNIGATNVLRTGSRPAALATLILDGGKGALAVMLADGLLNDRAAELAAIAAFVGHIYPVWLRFRGGKGVATYLGTMLALSMWVGVAACALWLLSAFMTRISSASALVMTAITPVLLWIAAGPSAAVAGLLMTVLVWWRHRENIARLRAGTEPRIGRR